MRCSECGLRGLVGVVFLLTTGLVGQGSTQAQASQSGVTKETLEEVRLLVRSGHDVAHATDLMLNEALLKDYGNGLTWLQAFSVIVAADKVVEKLDAKEYGAAALQAFLAAAHLEYGAKLSAATFPASFAYLASAPIRLSLHLFAKRAYNAALNLQLAFYLEARLRYGKSHDFIMAGRHDDEVIFTNRGWIYLVGEMTALSYGPRITAPQYSPEQVFGLALSLYQAKLQEPDVARQKREMLNKFAMIVAEGAVSEVRCADRFGLSALECSGREAAAVVRPGDSHGGVTFGPYGTISVGSTTLFQERLIGISNFDYFYLRVYGEGVRIVELYEVAEDLSPNLDDPLLATALVSAGGDVLEERIFPGN